MVIPETLQLPEHLSNRSYLPNTTIITLLHILSTWTHMAKRAIQLDLDEFRDAFLPASGRPIRTRNARRNAFSVLNDADELSTSALSERFVSRILALVVSSLPLI